MAKQRIDNRTSHDAIGRVDLGAGLSPGERAKKYEETEEPGWLGFGATRTMARRYVAADVLRDLDDAPQETYYRKPKGFSPEQQAKRQVLIAEIRALTGDPKYDGVGRRFAGEEDSHRWHSAGGSAGRAGHGHY